MVNVLTTLPLHVQYLPTLNAEYSSIYLQSTLTIYHLHKLFSLGLKVMKPFSIRKFSQAKQ